MDFTLELVRQLVDDDHGLREQWRARWKKIKLHQRRAASARKGRKHPSLPKPHEGAAVAPDDGHHPPSDLAEHVLAQAREEADQILEAARAEARTILESAREQADEISRSAKKMLLDAGSLGGHLLPDSAQLRARESLRILLVGPPAGGKGTQRAFLSRELGIPSVHLGDLYRKNIIEGTDLGVKVKSFIEAGLLIPDEIVLGILSERLADPDVHGGFLLDGVPRNLVEAEMIDEILALEAKRVDVALDFEIPREEAFKRLVGRRICTRDSSHVAHLAYAAPKRYGVCDVCGGDLALRADDSRRVIGQRWDVWNDVRKPIIQKYRGEGRLVTISGLGTIPDVTARAISALAEHFG
ncbi:nucleoside monophosphate kinase [Streptomyces sp. NPDC000880]